MVKMHRDLLLTVIGGFHIKGDSGSYVEFIETREDLLLIDLGHHG